jgi:hypothetical protein
MNFKDNKILLIVGAVVLLLLVAGGAFALMGKGSKPQETVEETEESAIPTLSKEELGLSMKLSPDNNKVMFQIDKAEDIKHIEYEITYDADSTEDESVKVPKGITGDEDVTGSPFKTDFLVLGTCSKNVCRYDTGIEEIKLLAKITKKDGKVYQAEDTLPVE